VAIAAFLGESEFLQLKVVECDDSITAALADMHPKRYAIGLAPGDEPRARPRGSEGTRLPRQTTCKSGCTKIKSTP
jgi:hypothetical protein